MPSLNSIFLVLFHTPIFCDTKKKVLRCFERGCIGRLPGDWEIKTGKSPPGEPATGLCDGWLPPARKAWWSCNLLPIMCAQGLCEEPWQSHLLASLSLSLRMLRSSSAKCVKGQGRCFMQAWFSALVVLRKPFHSIISVYIFWKQIITLMKN